MADLAPIAIAPVNHRLQVGWLAAFRRGEGWAYLGPAFVARKPHGLAAACLAAPAA